MPPGTPDASTGAVEPPRDKASVRAGADPRRASAGDAGSTPLQPIGASLASAATAPASRGYDAIVVGSGVGGCVVAALLAHGGRRVLVLERNASVGGILASVRRHGFKIDTGSHLIAQGERGPLGKVLRRLGLDHPRFLTHRIPFRSRGLLEITGPEHRRGLPAAAIEACDLLGLTMVERLHLARMMFQVFTLTQRELRGWDRRSLDEFIRAHTDHPAAYFLFSFLASIFYVLPPWSVSAGEAIRGLRQVIAAYRLSYLEGGMDRFACALLEVVKGKGGCILVESPVVALRGGSEGWVVTTAGGAAYAGKLVACNLDPKDLLPLLEPGAVPSAYAERVAGLRPSGNAHQVKLVLRRPLVQEGCLIAGVSLRGLTLAELGHEQMAATVRDIERGRVPDLLAIYAPVPTNFDPTLGPEGKQLIVASVYGPTIEDPEDPPERWGEAILQAFEQIVPGLCEELEVMELTAVPEIGRWMGKRSNAAICNGQWPLQVGRDRLGVETPLEGLYLCGDGAGGRGIGTELAASSAIEAAARMERRLEQPRYARARPSLDAQDAR